VRAQILALVAERSGMVFAANRGVEADSGIARAMKRRSSPDLAAYLRLVRGDGQALDDLVDELTVGETHFLRDTAQMELLRSEVLPALGRRRVPPRVWSAGCASGEEPYSLAILLEQGGMDAGAVILGTDLSPAALEKARAASYSDWSMRGVSDHFLLAYFRHERKRRILVDRIRNKVHFERLNLVGAMDYAAAGAAGMDLILCRNVLIYFDHATVGRIAKRLFDSLAAGGALLTAGSDPLLGEYAPFDVEMTAAGLLYRRPLRARIGHAPPPPPVAARPPVRPDAPPVISPPAAVAAPPSHDPAGDAFAQVMVIANGVGAFEAEVMARAAITRFPLDAPLHYLRATLLVALDRAAEAERESERALYLDPSLAVAHFLRGTILRRHGASGEARRAFRNARDLCAGRPPEEARPAGAGERVSALHAAAGAVMVRREVKVG
jgi:chemotaxis protein methyltransferase CheR